MERKCRKCGATFTPTRKTKFYCHDRCRAAYGQRVRRGRAIANPLTETEAYLLELILEMSALAVSIWVEVKSGVSRVSGTNTERLGRYGYLTGFEQVKQLKARYEEQKQLAAKQKRLEERKQQLASMPPRMAELAKQLDDKMRPS